jgi:hypothetical protein
MKLTWREELGLYGCPYLIRWIWETKWFSIRVHRWMGSDDQRHPHDHPWWFVSLVLWGCLQEVPSMKRRGFGSVGFFRAEHQHSVRLITKTAWTVLLTGPRKREWGFWVDGKFRRRNKYFFEHGHHACD